MGATFGARTTWILMKKLEAKTGPISRLPLKTNHPDCT